MLLAVHVHHAFVLQLKCTLGFHNILPYGSLFSAIDFMYAKLRNTWVALQTFDVYWLSKKHQSKWRLQTHDAIEYLKYHVTKYFHSLHFQHKLFYPNFKCKLVVSFFLQMSLKKYYGCSWRDTKYKKHTSGCFPVNETAMRSSRPFLMVPNNRKIT